MNMTSFVMFTSIVPVPYLYPERAMMTTDVLPPAAGTIVEWAPFRMRDGVDEATLLAAADRVQREFLAARPGFLRRELLRDAEGGWVDLVHWQDGASAQAAAEAAMATAVCLEYFELMRGADGAEQVGMPLHFRSARRW